MPPELIKNTATDVTELIDECDAGLLKQKIAALMSEAAMGIVNHGDGKTKAKVTLEFTMSRFNDNNQIVIVHKLSKEVPTKRGKKTESDSTSSVFFAGKGGQLTINAPKEDSAGQKNFHLHQES